MAQINRKDLGNAGRPKGLEFIGTQSLHGLEGAHIDGLDALIQHLGNDTKGEDGNRHRTGEGSQREDQGADQSDNQRGQGADQRQDKAEYADDHCAAVDIGGSQDRHRHGDGAANDCTQNGHFDGVQQRIYDLGEERPIRLENLLQQIQHLGKPADNGHHVKAGHFQCPHNGQHQANHDERRAASAAADGMSVFQRNDLRFEYLIKECLFVENSVFVIHTHSPSPMVGALAPL